MSQKKPFKRPIKYIKKSTFLKRNRRIIFIAMLLIIGFFIGKRIIYKQNINKQLVGKWYGKEGPIYGPISNFTYYEFDENGNGTKLRYPYDTPRRIYIERIERLSDTEMKLIFNSSWFFEDNVAIITKVDSITDNFFNGSITKESKFFNGKEDKISEGELMSFWEQDILPIINFDENIMLHRSNPYQVIVDDNDRIFENEKDLYILKSAFSDELRTGLQKFNYKDINQIELDDGDVLLAIYFIGKNYFRPYYESRIECYTHFGLFFAKNGNEWNLISLQEVSDCQDYSYQNKEPKKYEDPKIVETRDKMIQRAVMFYLSRKYNM